MGTGAGVMVRDEREPHSAEWGTRSRSKTLLLGCFHLEWKHVWHGWRKKVESERDVGGWREQLLCSEGKTSLSPFFIAIAFRFSLH